MLKLLDSIQIERSDLNKFQPRDVILTGHFEKINVVRKILNKTGFNIIGIVGVNSDNMEEIDLPIINREEIPLCIPVIFSGRPSKKYFNGPSFPTRNLFWFDPPGEAHKRMGFDPDFFYKNEKDILSFYDDLVDEESRITFLSIIKSRIEGECGYYRIADYLEYEHPIVKPNNGDVVFDIGAFDGDTARQFSKLVGVEGRVISVEASRSNFLKLCNVIVEENLKNVIPIYGAIWDKNQTLTFSGDDLASSKISSQGAEKVPAFTLDYLVVLLKLDRVNLIKMDIEGAESNALSGAQKTIAQFKPMLQLSAYHKPNDIWDLKAQVQSIVGDTYKFYLGHHNFYHTETDLYAISFP